MSESNPNSSIPRTQPSDRQPMVSQTPREHNLSGRNDLLSDPIDQENVQSDEEVMVSFEGDTNIDENVTIPNEATVQDPPPLRKVKGSSENRLDGFVEHGHESKVSKLQRSIYGLKQASRSWNKRFDEVIKTYGFDQNFDEPYVYKRIQDKKVIFLVLYVDDILLIGNDVGVLSSTKAWLAQQFHMKDLGEASYVLGIQILRDQKNKLLALSLSYIY
ncbi:Gag/pol protein [Abeliophyllum distichum]|uniref:Gag/pol protein n=1 Tax=Abeliophyllum distichum TaxID=126358 RepID=A0ABD1TIF0_9LAMI